MSVVLPVEVPPATRMFLRESDSCAKRLGLLYSHDAGADVVIEREHCDGGFADREGRSCDHRRQKALEPLARLGQFGRDTGASGMNLGADMVRDQPHDPLAIGGIKALTGIGQSLRKPVDPEPPVGVEHHLDDCRVFQELSDGRTQRRA